jgi:putative addiction module component (TIGR02574 family)
VQEAAMIKTENLFDEAIALPLEMRTKLVEKLLSSLNPSQKEIDKVWAKEAERRVEEIENGKVKAVPGERVFRKVRDRCMP